MSAHTHGSNRRNPRAATPFSLESHAFRDEYVRQHIYLAHTLEDLPPLHIPADLEGVAV